MKKIVLLVLLAFLSLQFTAQEKEGIKKSKSSEDVEKKYEKNYITPLINSS